MPAERRPLNLTLLGWGLTVPVAFLVAIGLACAEMPAAEFDASEFLMAE